MKKFLFILLLILTVISIVGCSNTSNSTNTNQDVNMPKFETPTVEEINLTTDNIDQYLSLSCSITDVVKNHLYDRDYSANGQMTIKSLPLQNGDFENVILTVGIVPTFNSGWAEGSREIRLPFDGKFEETFRKNSGVATHISTSPTFEIVVKSVSGKFIKR